MAVIGGVPWWYLPAGVLYVMGVFMGLWALLGWWCPTPCDSWIVEKLGIP